jgi:hypothetical protein
LGNKVLAVEDVIDAVERREMEDSQKLTLEVGQVKPKTQPVYQCVFFSCISRDHTSYQILSETCLAA